MLKLAQEKKVVFLTVLEREKRARALRAGGPAWTRPRPIPTCPRVKRRRRKSAGKRGGEKERRIGRKGNLVKARMKKKFNTLCFMFDL